MNRLSALLVLVLDRLTASQGRHEAPVVVRPEPVLDEAALTASWGALVTMLLTLLASLGVTESDAGVIGGLLVVVGGAVIAVVQAVLVLRRAYRVRAQVTPVSDPQLAPLLDAAPDEVEPPGPLDPASS